MLYSLPIDSYVSQYATYYLTCSVNAADPLSGQVTDMTALYNRLLTGVQDISVLCPTDTDVASSLSAVREVDTYLTSIRNSRGCTGIQTTLLASLNDGICTNVYNGFFGVWLAFFVALPCLYVVLATAAVVYEYFNVKYWSAAEANAHLLTWQTDPPKEKDAETDTASLPPQAEDPRINELSIETGTKEV